jgi:hypothetical protein
MPGFSDLAFMVAVGVAIPVSIEIAKALLRKRAGCNSGLPVARAVRQGA